MPHLEAPNHTQIPNVILDNLPSFTDGELRLVLAVARKTFGWHKERDELSLSQLQALTGMHRPMVNKAIKSLMSRNILERVPSGKQGFAYRLCVAEVTSTASEPVPPANQYAQSTETSILSEPELVRSEYTQKKDKEKKERGARASAAPAQPQQGETPQAITDSPPSEGNAFPPPRRRDLVFEALAEATGFDPALGTAKDRGAINQFCKVLRTKAQAEGYDDAAIAERIAYVARYWRRTDWRGQKGETPDVSMLRKAWRAAIDARAAQAAPPPSPTPEPPRQIATKDDWKAAVEAYAAQPNAPAFLRRYLAAGVAQAADAA